MRAIIFDTAIDREARNRKEGELRGYNGTSTCYPWAMVDGKNGKFALLIGDDTVSETVEEITEDWFADN